MRYLYLYLAFLFMQKNGLIRMLRLIPMLRKLPGEGDQFLRPLFAFLINLYVRQKQVVNILILIYFGRPPLGHAIKTNFVTFQVVDLDLCSILIYYKRVQDQLLHQILCMIFKTTISEGQNPTLSCPIILNKVKPSPFYFLR